MDIKQYEKLTLALNEQLKLQEDLIFLLNEEKDALLKMDLITIEKFSKVKKELALKIEKSQQGALCLVKSIACNLSMETITIPTLNDLAEKIIEPYKSNFKKIAQTLKRFKTIILAASNTNKIFIEQALSLVNGSIDILIGTDQLSGEGYNTSGKKSTNKHTQPIKFSRDV